MQGMWSEVFISFRKSEVRFKAMVLFIYNVKVAQNISIIDAE